VTPRLKSSSRLSTFQLSSCRYKLFWRCLFPLLAFNASVCVVGSLLIGLCSYASGRTTGIVLDSGDGVSHAVPVYEGFAMPAAIRRIDVAGRDVTENLQVLLRKSGAIFHTSAEMEIVRLIKEKACFVALDPKKEEKDWAGGGTGRIEQYMLPDGNVLRVATAFPGERCRAD